MKFSELEVGDTIIFRYNQPLNQDSYIVKKKIKKGYYISFSMYRVKESLLYKNITYHEGAIIESYARVIKKEFNILDYI